MQMHVRACCDLIGAFCKGTGGHSQAPCEFENAVLKANGYLLKRGHIHNGKCDMAHSDALTVTIQSTGETT